MPAIRPLLLAAPLAFLAARSDAAPQWRESLGGPGGTYCAEGVEGPRTAPVEAWRVAFDELLCEPVVNAGHVAVVAREGRSVRLVVLDVETGEPVVRKRVRGSGSAAISFDESFLAVVTDEEFLGGEFRMGRFRRTVGERRAFPGLVSTSGRFAAVPVEEGTRFYDLDRGDLVGEAAATLRKPIPAGPVARGDLAVFHVAARVETRFGPRLQLQTVRIRAGDRGPELRADTDDFPVGARDGEVGASFQRLDWSAGGPLFALGEFVARTRSWSIAVPAVASPGRGHILSVAEIPAVHEGWIVARIEGGSVLSVSDDPAVAREQPGPRTPGRTAGVRFLVDGDHLPPGATEAPLSVAGDVLLLGNWAVDVESSRVLWVAEDLDVVGRPISAGDGAIVFESTGAALVLARARPGALDAAPEAALATEGAPGDGAAVVLRNGQRIAGRVERDGDAFVLRGERGDERGRHSDFSVAAVEGADGLEDVRMPYAVCLAANRALEVELAAELVDAASEAADLSLVRRARELVDELERLGASRASIASIENVLATKRELETATRGVKLEKVDAIVAGARERARERRARLVRWIHAEGLPVQAMAVLSRHWLDDGSPKPLRSVPEHVARVVGELMPPDEDDGVLERLGRWEAFAPADIRYATAEEIGEIDVQTRTWTRCAVICTEHIVLMTKEKRSDVLAGVLLFGETTIQALDAILGADPAVVEEPFDVRLHATRESYLEEEVRGMAIAPGWSAGFYNAFMGTSRFFVPAVDPSRLERQLYKTVAHELTHQYVSERWRRRVDDELRTPMVPGFWIVEGFAGFIEEQSVEMARFGLGFDDATVESIEISAALLDAGKLTPIEEFLAFRQLDLQRLALEEDSTVVHLRNERASYDVGALSAFYSQAAALAFFMMNHAGEEGPARLVDALEAHYAGRSSPEGWTALGFGSAEALEAEFEAFLRAAVSR